jgi:type VI secretion system secreted protein Hcp
MSPGQGTQVKAGNFRAFLRIDGIRGDSMDAQHMDEIELATFSWGEWGAAVMSNTGFRLSGPVEMQPFAFTMPVSSASPKLFLACASGEIIPEAVLTVRDPAGREYLVLRLVDVLVTSYKTAADTTQDVLPIDEVALRFNKIEMAFRPLKPDGTLAEPIKAGWDLAQNRPN